MAVSTINISIICVTILLFMLIVMIGGRKNEK